MSSADALLIYANRLSPTGLDCVLIILGGGHDDDRAKLAQTIKSTPHANIIVTHGTFTMKQTALFLEEQGFADKKVILTGSMIPITGFTTSDAGFNLGFVIASFTSVDNGVYLSMNGGTFGADEVSKNEELFRFE